LNSNGSPAEWYDDHGVKGELLFRPSTLNATRQTAAGPARIAENLPDPGNPPLRAFKGLVL
jgi:hypothetical protein